MWRNCCKMDIFHFNLCNCADFLGQLLHIVLSKPAVRNFRDCLNLLYPAWALYPWVSIIFLSVTGIFVYFQDNYIDEKLLVTLRDKPSTSWGAFTMESLSSMLICCLIQLLLIRPNQIMCDSVWNLCDTLWLSFCLLFVFQCFHVTQDNYILFLTSFHSIMRYHYSSEWLLLFQTCFYDILWQQNIKCLFYVRLFEIQNSPILNPMAVGFLLQICTHWWGKYSCWFIDLRNSLFIFQGKTVS